MQLIDAPRKTTYTIVFGVSSVIVLWALIHDLILVQIAPEHFTEYHEPLWEIQSPILIATLYALGASIGPGMLMGIAAACLGRSGPRKKLAPRALIQGTLFVVLATEIAAAASGMIVFLRGEVFYPRDWFPDMTVPIQISQTVQITAYLAMSVFSAIFLIGVHLRRRRQ